MAQKGYVRLVESVKTGVRCYFFLQLICASFRSLGDGSHRIKLDQPVFCGCLYSGQHGYYEVSALFTFLVVNEFTCCYHYNIFKANLTFQYHLRSVKIGDGQGTFVFVSDGNTESIFTYSPVSEITSKYKDVSSYVTLFIVIRGFVLVLFYQFVCSHCY